MTAPRFHTLHKTRPAKSLLCYVIKKQLKNKIKQKQKTTKFTKNIKKKNNNKKENNNKKTANIKIDKNKSCVFIYSFL